MANKIKGGPDTEAITTSTNGTSPKSFHSLTLKFIEDEDKDLYAALTADAKKDRRSLDQFVVLYLLANYPFNSLSDITPAEG